MPPEPSLPSKRRARLSLLAAMLLLVVLPSLLLYEPLVEGDRFLPFDLSTFPPASCSLTPEALAARRAPGNYDITEKSTICTPEFRFARAELVEGRFPHWNPYVRGGAPLFANALDGFAYPFHLPFLLLDPDRAYGMVAWLDFILAGMFMLGFLRSIGLTWMSATFGAVVFQLSGTLAANAHFFMRMEPLIWLPAGFWALERLFHTRGAQRLPPLAGFALSVGLCWLAGFPPYALAISLAFGLYALELLRRTWIQRGRTLALHFAGYAAVGTAIGLGIAMVQLVPMLDYFPESQRKLDQTLSELVAQGLDPSGLAGLVLPMPFSSPLGGEAIPAMYNPLLYMAWSSTDPETGRLFLPYGSYNFTEYAIYLGVLPMLACVFALLRASVRFRWFALAGILVFALLGTAGPLFQLAWSVPVFQSTPPFRYAAMLAFFGAALAGIGFEVGTDGLRRLGMWTCFGLILLLGTVLLWLAVEANSLSGDPDAARIVAAEISEKWKADYPEVAGDVDRVANILGTETGPPHLTNWTRYAFSHLRDQVWHALLFVGLGLAWLLLGRMALFRRSRAARVLLRLGILGVVAADLLLAARHVNPSFPPRNTENTEIHKFLRLQREALRTEGGYMVARISPEPIEPKQLIPNTLVPDRIRDLNAYAFVDRNSHRPFHRLYGDSVKLRGEWLRSFPVDARLGHSLFDLYGVRYLLSEHEFEALGPPAIPPLQGPGGSFYVYERKTALPRAFLVRTAREERDEERVLGYLTSKNLQPRELVLLGEQIGQPAEGIDTGLLANDATPEQLAAASVQFVQDTSTEIKLIVRRSPGAWLHLSDTAMRNWRLEIDGSEAPWYRANLSFRACWVSKGDHELRWRYDAGPFAQGLWISAGSAALLLLLLLWWTGAPRAPRKDAEILELSSRNSAD